MDRLEGAGTSTASGKKVARPRFSKYGRRGKFLAPKIDPEKAATYFVAR